MDRLFYFKVTFLSISVGLFVGILVYGLFDIDFSNSEALKTLVLKSLATGVGTGFVLGVLNMFFKIENFPKKEN
jgi:hypothetical protein